MKEGRHHWTIGSEPHWPGQTALRRAAKYTSELAPGTQPFYLYRATNPAPPAIWVYCLVLGAAWNPGLCVYTKHVCHH